MEAKYGAAVDHSLEVGRLSCKRDSCDVGQQPCWAHIAVQEPQQGGKICGEGSLCRRSRLCSQCPACLTQTDRSHPPAQTSQALFSLSRYFGNPKAEAAKRRLWEPEVSLPGALIALAQQPLSAWGHDGRQDEEGVLERDEPPERYLSSCNNIVRVMGCLVQVGHAQCVCVCVCGACREALGGHACGRRAAWGRSGACWSVVSKVCGIGQLGWARLLCCCAQQRRGCSASTVDTMQIAMLPFATAQKGGPLDFGSTMKKHGELLQQPGIFAAFRELLQVGVVV